MILLFKMLRKRLHLALATVLISGLAAVIFLYWNGQLRDCISRVSGGQPLPANSIVPALMTILGMGLSAYAKGCISGYTCECMAHDLRMGYARHFASLPVEQAERLRVGEQLSKLQNEIADISGYLNANLFQLLDDGIKFTVSLTGLLFLNPALTLAVNLPVLVIMVYAFYSSKAIRSAAERSQQAKGRMNDYADTLFTLFPVIRLYSAARFVLRGYGEAVGEWMRQDIRAERVKARLMTLSAVLSSIPLALLFWVGGGMTINGALTIGTLYVFLNLSGNVSGVLMNVPQYIAALRQFSVLMKRLSPHVSFDERG